MPYIVSFYMILKLVTENVDSLRFILSYSKDEFKHSFATVETPTPPSNMSMFDDEKEPFEYELMETDQNEYEFEPEDDPSEEEPSEDKHEEPLPTPVAPTPPTQSERTPSFQRFLNHLNETLMTYTHGKPSEFHRWTLPQLLLLLPNSLLSPPMNGYSAMGLVPGTI
ncbi:hypothetical protein Tco_0250560 [Tanacetum coccineum]